MHSESLPYKYVWGHFCKFSVSFVKHLRKGDFKKAIGRQ